MHNIDGKIEFVSTHVQIFRGQMLSLSKIFFFNQRQIEAVQKDLPGKSKVNVFNFPCPKIISNWLFHFEMGPDGINPLVMGLGG